MLPVNGSSPKHLSKLLVLLAAGCLTAMTGSLVSPVLPDIVEQLDIDPQWAGLLVSMHCLTIALFSPLWGILADRIGKVKVLIPALILYALFGSAGALMNSFGSLLIARGLVGAASGGIAAASIGLMSNMYEGEARSRILGYATSALATTSIFFPLLGGWLGSIHWQFAFCLYGLALPVAVFAALILREKPDQNTSSMALGQSGKLLQSLRQPSTLTLFLALALTSAVFYVVIIYAPLYFKATIGAGSVLNGAILASRAIGAAIVSALGASRLARRLGIAQALALGFILMALTLIAIPMLRQTPGILLTAVIFGAGFGIVMPNLYDALAKLTSQELQASILAIGTGSSSLGQFLSPIFLGPVWKHSGITVFYVGAFVAIVTAVLSLIQVKPSQD
jgi:MFS transporter, ACDE family, multidrug resistance protein